MKQLGLTTFATFGVLAAVGACGEDDPQTSPGTGGTPANTGGTSAGTSGSGGGGSGGLSQECSGPGGRPVLMGPQPQREENVQCYVTEATNGEPQCLAADDPAILARLGDSISSCGFVTEFVIAATESQPVPAACEELLECCESLTDWQGQQCHDRVDSGGRDCAAFLQTYRSQSLCSEPSGGDAGVDAGLSMEADAGESARSSRYALCCYRACAYIHCI
jgi:hypothetical protein